MTTTTATKPWKIERAGSMDGEPVHIIKANDSSLPNVATVYGRAGESPDNANLIAAAPELLAALEALKEWGCTHTSPSVEVTITPDNSPHDLLVAACEAIAKATGESV